MEKDLKMKVDPRKPITPTLKNMELYDKEYFLIEKMKTIRSTTTYLKTAYYKVFKTKQHNKERIIEVTRIA